MTEEPREKVHVSEREEKEKITVTVKVKLQTNRKNPNTCPTKYDFGKTYSKVVLFPDISFFTNDYKMNLKIIDPK